MAPYLIKRKGAKISLPITCDELDKVAPDGITMDALTCMQKEDPWKGFFDQKQVLR